MKKIRRRSSTAVAWVAAAAALYGAPAFSDSAAGVDTALGNAMNPALPGGVPAADPDAEIDERSPTGMLYPQAYRQPEERATTANGWVYRGQLDVGGIHVTGDKSNALFRQYKDLRSGLYLDSFQLEAEKPTDKLFFEALGGGVGYDDQFYGAQFGRFNEWKVKAFYNETPHVFTTTFRSLWSGLGTNNLTLDSLTPGGSATALATQGNIRNALLTTGESELSVIRKKGGVRVDARLSPAWNFYASATAEKREGSRPYAAVWGGGGGGGNVEIPESIDYNTYDLLAGVRYADPLNSLNLSVNATLFRNDIDAMRFENPLMVTLNTIVGVPASTFAHGIYDQYPDNDHYNVRGEYARAFPESYNSRFTAVVSLSRSKQNDALLAPTPFSLASGTINGISAANVWNTTAALTRQSADARIESALVDLGLAVNPTPDWNVRAKVRYYETDNNTDYLACNPLTGQWGRLLNEGSGGGFVNTPAYVAARCDLEAVRALGLVPSAGNINIRNVPFDHRQIDYSVAADYRIDTRSSVEGLIERSDYEPRYRERDETWEDHVRLGYVNRGLLPGGTLRASYEYARKRGSEYHADPYEDFLSGSMGPLPTAVGTNAANWIHIMDSFRKYDLADRDQNVVNARFNWMVVEQLDAGISAQHRDARYPNSEYGRDGTQRQTSVNFDLNYQHSAELSAYGYYSYQESRMQQRGLQANQCLVGTTYYFWSNGQVTATNAPPMAGVTLVTTTAITGANWLEICGNASPASPLYPTSRIWDVDQKSTNHMVGGGIRYDLRKAFLDLNATYLDSRTKIGYDYNADALGLTPTMAALAGDGWSDLVFRQLALQASVLVPVNKNLAARVFYRYENGRIDDWHYDGVDANPVPAANAVYLDAGPQSYHTNVFGVLLRWLM